MDSTDLEVLRHARDWLRAGRRVELATIATTFGSAPRPIGAMLAVDDRGEFCGSVSGGCVEEELIAQMRDGLHPHAQIVTYGITAEQSRRHGLPCGGKLELVVETLNDVRLIASIVEAVEQRRTITRRLNLLNNISRLLPSASTALVDVDGDCVEFTYGPQWRMLIVGAGDLGRYLAQMANMLNYQVSVCDPRKEFWSTWTSSDVNRSMDMPDDFIRTHAPDGRTVIAVVAHDPKLDDMALLEALPSAAFYVGALGSQRNNDERRRRLAHEFDIPASQLERLHGPVGLNIGSRSAPEIAISILAEVTALRNGIRLSVTSDMNPRLNSVSSGACHSSRSENIS
ncbi:MAG: XdhC family protein [Gammaproteobacteria bacterium]